MSMKKKVFIYSRKSSESEDRQILSIESQIGELKKTAQHLNLEIIEILTESKSAKAPGRPVFSTMLERLYKGEADGVLCWKLDRLARNPIDGGSIIWAIKNNGISIFTPSQTYSREQENQLLMYVEFGMAQKFIDDLGKNAKRGMNTKAEMGWYPQHAPIGYINTPSKRKGLKTIEKDVVRFEIAKRSFKEVINGRNAMVVYKLATNKWGLTSPTTGNPIAISTFYKMLNNPFYYGEFLWNGTWHIGKHEPMITKDEFDIVQRMLGKLGKPVQRAQTFDLTGLFRCKQCGCALTASRKVKHYKETDRYVAYVYYHCTKKKRDMNCTQKPMTEKDMTKDLIRQLLNARPSQAFIDWAKKWISFLHENEAGFQENVMKNKHDELEKVENRLNKLLDLYINEGISEPVYKQKQAELERLKLNLQHKVQEADEGMNDWRIKVENTLDYARAMADRFEHGNKEVKHQILIKISSDLTYRTKKPLIQLKEEYESIRKLNNGEYKTDTAARTLKYADVFVQRPDLIPPNSMMLRWLKAVRTFFINQILTPTLDTQVDITVLNNCFKGNQPALSLIK